MMYKIQNGAFPEYGDSEDFPLQISKVDIFLITLFVAVDHF